MIVLNLAQTFYRFWNHYGSFFNYWRTNILFAIARATAMNAAEAARRHRVSHAAHVAAGFYIFTF